MMMTREERIKFIKANYTKMTAPELAKKCFVTEGAMYRERSELAREGIIDRNKFKKVKRRNHNPRHNTQYGCFEQKKKELDKAILKLDNKIKLGKKYRIKKTGYIGTSDIENFTGELVQITDIFYTFQNRNRAESYLKIDIIIGDYQISEVK